MHAIKKTVAVSIAALALTASIVVGSRAIGVTAAAARPSAVVTVNVPLVMEKLSQRSSAEANLQRMADEIVTEDEARKGRIDTITKELTDMPQNAANREAKEEELAMVRLEHQAWQVFASEQLDIEKSLMLRELDRVILVGIAELAQINGYDIVMMDDSAKRIGINSQAKVSRENQVKQQMTSRRLLYVDPAVDVTDELIERMNNTFNAGG